MRGFARLAAAIQHKLPPFATVGSLLLKFASPTAAPCDTWCFGTNGGRSGKQSGSLPTTARLGDGIGTSFATSRPWCQTR